MPVGGKGIALKWIQEMTTVPDCLGVCKIFYILSAGYSVFTFDDFAKIYQAATGIKSSGEGESLPQRRLDGARQPLGRRRGRDDRASASAFPHHHPWSARFRRRPRGRLRGVGRQPVSRRRRLVERPLRPADQFNAQPAPLPHARGRRPSEGRSPRA